MVAAYVFVTVEPGRNAEVVKALRAAGGVKQANVCWGVPDIVAFVEAADDRALSQIVLDKIQRVPGIRGTETHIVIAD